jgi:hypothetical protein
MGMYNTDLYRSLSACTNFKPNNKCINPISNRVPQINIYTLFRGTTRERTMVIINKVEIINIVLTNGGVIKSIKTSKNVNDFFLIDSLKKIGA